MQRYHIKGETEKPLRFKTNGQNEHRANKEFSYTTKLAKFKETSGKCEQCQIQLDFKDAQFHHLLSLSYAFHYFPEKFPDEFLRSEANCVVLCTDCHNQFHESDSLSYYTTIVMILEQVLKEWEKPIGRRTITRNPRKRHRRELQARELERRAREQK